MSARTLLAVAVVALLPSVAAASGPTPEPPPGTVFVPALGGFELWPYTGSDYSGEPYDPINLMLLDVDPREVRQVLLGLDGERGLPPELPFGDCVWADAMGSEQVVWAETLGWVGGEVQLVCINPSAPSPFRELGDPFRVHARFYRQGNITLVAAHFEVLILNTAQHQVLSWDFARDFVALDLIRGGLGPAGPPAGLQTPGSFRAVLRPVYNALVDSGATGLLAFLDLFPPPGPGDVPIPLDTGAAFVFSGDVAFEPVQEKIRTQITAPYNVEVPRPFCASFPGDGVRLEGALSLSLSVHTNPSGKYERWYEISGTLYVTPGYFTADGVFHELGLPAEPAQIAERHRALLTDEYGQLYELGSQELQGDEPQSLQWRLDAGQRDRYRAAETCGP